MKNLFKMLSFISLFPILFFTYKYVWLFHFLIKFFLILLLSFNYLYMGVIDDFDILNKLNETIDKISNILLSEGHPDENFAKDFSKSVNRVKDFINIAGKDGSGSYPEDFHYQGYKKDDNTITYSKVPGDWGINEEYEFGKYSDLSKRNESAGQMAKWLEYDHRVNQKRAVDLISNDQTFNSSGQQWFKDYCKDKGLYHENIYNDYVLRKNMRDIAAGRK